MMTDSPLPVPMRPRLPLLIGVAAVVAMVAGAFGIIALILIELAGGGVTRVNERILGGSQAAIVVVAMALAVVGMFVTGFAAITHRRWARPVMILAFGAFIGALVSQIPAVPYQAGFAVVGIVIVLGWWYFYHKRSVREYYAAVEEANVSGMRYGQARADQPLGFWRRHWGWAVVAVSVFCAVLVPVEVEQWRQMPVIQQAVAAAQANPRADSALGTPITMGLLPAGHIAFATGNASLSIPLSGPKAKGFLFVTAAEDSGAWKFTTMILARPDGYDTLVWQPRAVATDSLTSSR
jgi:hypothetical protein